MKKINNNELMGKPLETLVTELSKNKEFREAHAAEVARRRLAKQIYDLRTIHQLTQHMVAKKTGMPQSVIARIESGDRGISVETLDKIARAFGKEVQLV